ncbi:hypothetical protein [Peptococcus niger]|uniref:hypothetical protein n=1 Tax=Peptococcus niger TaxID=2741 RepID=UPI000B881EF6|nr:hypothetical protein [Peptococcus niger]
MGHAGGQGVRPAGKDKRPTTDPPAGPGRLVPIGWRRFPFDREKFPALHLSDRTECDKKAGLIWPTGLYPSCRVNLQKKQGEIGERRVHGRALLVY